MADAHDGPVSSAPFLAYLAPMAVFMAITSFESHTSVQPYYGAIYAVKLIVVGSLLFWFWSRYPKFSANGLGEAIGFGIIGFGIWVGLASVDLSGYLPESIRSWVTGKRAGFDPASMDVPMRFGVIALRLVGLVLIVPIMEEVFWRGFLWRYLINESFHQVEMGRYSGTSFLVVIVFFTAVHPEWLAAAAWCAGINFLLVRTKNLWACIMAHAVTNALLGIYILGTGCYWLW